METDKKHILYVEDHSDTFELVVAVLSDYQVVRAANLSGGVELALDEYFDLYLSDYQLGDGTGLDFCRQVRAFDPVTPILICSASPEITESQVRDAGAQSFISKGDGFIDQLETCIHSLISEARMKIDTVHQGTDFKARQAEFLAICEELEARYAESAARLELARQMHERARGRALKAKACRAYMGESGTRREFERLWSMSFRTDLLL